MRKILLLFTLFALCFGVFVLPCHAAEEEAPSIPSIGDVWDGVTITAPSKLVKKDGVNYYEITKCSELAYIAQTGGEWLERNYLLANNLILNDVVLEWDEEGNLLNDPETLHLWQPIGINQTFSGIFNGNGYTVSGLYVGNMWEYSGLFGYSYDGTIKALSVVNAWVDGNSNIGGIVGQSDKNSMVIDCIFSGRIRGISFLGGIIGQGGNADQCVNYGTVTGIGNGSKSKDGKIGGIIGGGSIGFHVTNCVNYGEVTGNQSVGGIVGSFSSSGNSISGCVNYGSVTCSENGAGGITSTGVGGITITGCVNYGEVSVTTRMAGGITVCGMVSDCANYGSVTCGDAYAGGIVACSYSSNSIISRCYNTAAITGENDYVGGIAGYWGEGSLTDCYNIGSVVCNEATGSAGAIVGSEHPVWGKSVVTGCYYLKTDTVNAGIYSCGGVTSAEMEPDGVRACFEEEMKIQSTYTDWNFANDWDISSLQNDGYPYILKRNYNENPEDEYHIGALKIRSTDGTELSEIPAGPFLVTVPITKQNDGGDSLVFLASYTASGQFKGMMYVNISTASIGTTVEVSLPVDNTKGDIARLKAFPVASFDNLVPIGNASSFPSEL